MENASQLMSSLVDWLPAILGFMTLTLLVWVVILYIVDRTQTESTLRRNYPVIARFRYFFEHLGEFFRQYFFAMDREELPFNRAERSWCYRAAKDVDSTVAFGSTRDLRKSGAVMFLNSAFPPLSNDYSCRAMVIGERCRHPYEAKSFFNISGMSYGALSKPAVRALSKGAHKAGIWMNTGEGGLAPYHLEGGADIVFQIGTAKFGVRNLTGEGFDEQRLLAVAGHEQVKMFEIKLSQGAKPGKGGILPGEKVTKEIAEIRNIKVGEDAISPNRHPELNSAADVLDMIDYVRETTGKPVGIKTAIGNVDWLDELCKLIKKRGEDSAPDFITIDSADGGTGAAPMSLMDNMALPIREALPMVVAKLKKHKLRERIRIISSGKLVNPTEVAWALASGADFINCARGFMFALGCIQALQCNKNTCPTGITTHNKKLQKGLNIDDKAERVMHYAKNMLKEVNVIAHSCGLECPRELTTSHAQMTVGHGVSTRLDKLYERYED